MFQLLTCYAQNLDAPKYTLRSLKALGLLIGWQEIMHVNGVNNVVTDVDFAH